MGKKNANEGKSVEMDKIIAIALLQVRFESTFPLIILLTYSVYSFSLSMKISVMRKNIAVYFSVYTNLL